MLQAVAHTRSLVTPGCFTTTVHRGSQVQVRGALSTRHCGFMCTLSAQRACVYACVMRACASHARVACTCCSCPALLCVPLLCIRVLRAFVLGVWCTCAGFSQIVRHPLVNVVDIAGVHRPVL